MNSTRREFVIGSVTAAAGVAAAATTAGAGTHRAAAGQSAGTPGGVQGGTDVGGAGDAVRPSGEDG